MNRAGRKQRRTCAVHLWKETGLKISPRPDGHRLLSICEQCGCRKFGPWVPLESSVKKGAEGS